MPQLLACVGSAAEHFLSACVEHFTHQVYLAVNVQGSFCAEVLCPSGRMILATALDKDPGT